MQQLEIESLDMEARGVGHLKNEDGTPGKVIFVDGALPGELVSFESFRRKAKWEAATLVEVHRESALRVVPKCDFFGVCGGCAMQHVESTAQVAIKQRVLEDSLWHIGKVRPAMVLRPIHGPTWNYRYRARLSVRNVRKKGTVLVGFREKKSPYVTDMSSCQVLPPNVSALLLPLRELIASLSIVDQVPQLELAVGDGEHGATTVLVLRHMAPLHDADEQLLIAFANRHRIEWWLQAHGPDSAQPFYPAVSQLHYLLPEFGIRMPFKPTDFTQVNHQINRLLVTRVVQLLDLHAHHRVADLFCGLGNFTLPLATRAHAVLGIEGSAALVERARSNAVLNGLTEKASFACRNLFELNSADLVALGKFDRLLIDPPRDGAAALCAALAGLSEGQQPFKPARIVYVSCNPATLARDAGVLVHEAGYVLQQAGAVNMFPHTAHVESIAVFELAAGQNT